MQAALCCHIRQQQTTYVTGFVFSRVDMFPWGERVLVPLCTRTCAAHARATLAVTLASASAVAFLAATMTPRLIWAGAGEGAEVTMSSQATCGRDLDRTRR